MGVEFRLLGAVEIWSGGQVLDAGEPRRRAVLAALLYDAGRVVPSSTLIARVWGDDPPAQAVKTLGTHVTRIRRTLTKIVDGEQPVTVVSQAGGYRLSVEADRVDLHRFRRLVVEARDPELVGEQRAATLREAMGLFKGEPLTGVPGDWADRTREHLVRERLDATADWATAELEVGNAAAVITPLAPLADENPTMEHLTAALVRALAAAGRPGEALERCWAHRQRLIDELGIEQGPQLRRLYETVLRGDEQATQAAPASAPAVSEPAPGVSEPAPARALAEPAVSQVSEAPLPMPAPNPLPEPQAPPGPARRWSHRRAGLLAAAAAIVVTAGLGTALALGHGPGAGSRGVGTGLRSSSPVTAAATAPSPSPKPSHSHPTGPAFDDFTGAALDLSAWNPYDAQRANGSTWSSRMVRVVGGELQLSGKGRNPKGRGNIAGAACWCEDGGAKRTYGVWETKAKFDYGPGYGVEIGLYPNDGLPEDEGILTMARSDDGGRGIVGSEAMGIDRNVIPGVPQSGDFTDWATYRVEWRPDFVRISINGITTFDSRTSSKPVKIPSKRMYLYVQMKPGPDGPIPGPNADTPSQTAIHVDWVRYTP